jgi:50S ribosome-binding GTPase
MLTSLYLGAAVGATPAVEDMAWGRCSTRNCRPAVGRAQRWAPKNRKLCCDSASLPAQTERPSTSRTRSRQPSAYYTDAAAAAARPQAAERDSNPSTSGKWAEDPHGHRSGFIAIVGRPNAGKSTLLNKLMGQELSITSPAAQTTRRRVLGIMSDPNYQVLRRTSPLSPHSLMP